ncbi:hypothetical protein GCM10009122_31070 [Fulvivirga kasyanovii]
MIDEVVLCIVVEQFIVNGDGCFFIRIAHGVLGDLKVRTEAIDLIGYCILEALEDQERDDHHRKPYTDTANRYFVYGGRKAIRLISGNSFGYKIR